MWPVMAEGRSACCEFGDEFAIVKLCAAPVCKISVCDERNPVVQYSPYTASGLVGPQLA